MPRIPLVGLHGTRTHGLVAVVLTDIDAVIARYVDFQQLRIQTDARRRLDQVVVERGHALRILAAVTTHNGGNRVGVGQIEGFVPVNLSAIDRVHDAIAIEIGSNGLALHVVVSRRIQVTVAIDPRRITVHVVDRTRLQHPVAQCCFNAVTCCRPDHDRFNRYIAAQHDPAARRKRVVLE